MVGKKTGTALKLNQYCNTLSKICMIHCKRMVHDKRLLRNLSWGNTYLSKFSQARICWYYLVCMTHEQLLCKYLNFFWLFYGCCPVYSTVNESNSLQWHQSKIWRHPLIRHKVQTHDSKLGQQELGFCLQTLNCSTTDTSDCMLFQVT